MKKNIVIMIGLVLCGVAFGYLVGQHVGYLRGEHITNEIWFSKMTAFLDRIEAEDYALVKIPPGRELGLRQVEDSK